MLVQINIYKNEIMNGSFLAQRLPYICAIFMRKGYIRSVKIIRISFRKDKERSHRYEILQKTYEFTIYDSFVILFTYVLCYNNLMNIGNYWNWREQYAR